MIQQSVFTTGGFVLHKVALAGSKYSAWYGPEGDLVDAEQILANGRTRSVPARHGAIRADLAILGRRYARMATAI